jgi:hypothetical protein
MSCRTTHDIYSKKFLSLRNARALETDVSVKLKLDMQIDETKGGTTQA